MGALPWRRLVRSVCVKLGCSDKLTRGSLFTVPGKIFGKNEPGRTQEVIISEIWKAQCGCMPGRECTDWN